MDIKKAIIDYCNSIGIYCVGFTKCRVFNELEGFYKSRKEKGLFNEFEEQHIDKKINPFYLMEEGNTIISFAIPYAFDSNWDSTVYFSKYARGRDYHIVLRNCLEKVRVFIESIGGKGLCLVDSNALPERYIAMLSGVGFIGKNNCLITEKYGSYVFLGEIITNLYIEEDMPKESKCGQCNLCSIACPTKAILYSHSEKEINNKGINNNSNICLSYITQKKDLDNIWFDKLQGRIFGCDTCQKVCPFNQKIEFSNIEDFKPYDFMEIVNIHELLNIDNNIFKEKYKLSSCGWRGKNILMRNAMIEAFNKGDISFIKNIKINSPYVEQYYHRLLKNFNL